MISPNIIESLVHHSKLPIHSETLIAYKRFSARNNIS